MLHYTRNLLVPTNVHRNAVVLTGNFDSLFSLPRRGVNFRALGELFALSAKDEVKEFQFRVSMLEVKTMMHKRAI